MKRVIVIAALGLIAAGAAYSAASPPITAQPLGSARLAKPFTVRVKPGDLTVLQAKVMPGGDFGWHTHRSPVAVAVLGGTLSLYDSSEPTCTADRIAAGHGFIEVANHIHLARNEGTVPVRLLVVYLGAPHGAQPDVPAAQPQQCPSVK